MNMLAAFHETSKHYNGKPALQSLTLAIAGGECVALLGPNGAGKTTALRLLMGLIFPTSGSVELFGKPPSDPSARTDVGYLPGEMGWPLGVRVAEWLSFLASLSRKPDQQRRWELLNILEFPPERLNSYIGTLSQGEKRKIGLVATLEPSPELLVLDEPGEGLDPVQQRRLITMLQNRQAGSALILSTHDLREAFELADRIAVFSQGRLVEIVAKREVMSVAELETLFFAGVRES